MATQSNHHFVPQFYFRNFSTDGRRINLLNKKSGKVVHEASIRHQCARRKFYVAQEIESAFARLEMDQARAIRQFLNASVDLDDLTFVQLCQTILFQRGRTLHEAEKHAPAHEQMHLEWFKLHLINQGEQEMHDRLVEAERLGQVKVTADRRQVVAMLLSTLADQTKMIVDLEIHALHNLTDYPFIFGDSPLIFYNSHLRRVTDRGVLGLQQPGLQIFFPLSSQVALLLIDENTYRGQFRASFGVDLYLRSDVSQLNSLQLHSSSENIYFEHSKDEAYVYDLWHSHRHTCKPVTTQFVRRMMCIDGNPTPQEIFHYYEPQFPCELNVSFIESDPIAPKDFRWQYRCPELYEEAKAERARFEKTFTP